jgi:hypothetical protein
MSPNDITSQACLVFAAGFPYAGSRLSKRTWCAFSDRTAPHVVQYLLCRVSTNKVKRSERADFDSTTTIQANRGSYMFVVIDDRESVTQGYAAGFDREGEVSIGFSSKDFRDWLECAVGNDVLAIGAFILGDCSDRTSMATITTSRWQTRCAAPSTAISYSIAR